MYRLLRFLLKEKIVADRVSGNSRVELNLCRDRCCGQSEQNTECENSYNSSTFRWYIYILSTKPRTRLVGCERLDQALGSQEVVDWIPGCIQNVACTHVKAPSTQAPGIPPNRAFPQSHPRLWLPWAKSGQPPHERLRPWRWRELPRAGEKGGGRILSPPAETAPLFLPPPLTTLFEIVISPLRAHFSRAQGR
jgi:hypothetical protein